MTIYTIECPRCHDGDLGSATDYHDARERAHRHEDAVGHTARIFENGVIAD